MRFEIALRYVFASKTDKSLVISMSRATVPVMRGAAKLAPDTKTCDPPGFGSSEQDTFHKADDGEDHEDRHGADDRHGDPVVLDEGEDLFVEPVESVGVKHGVEHSS